MAIIFLCLLLQHNMLASSAFLLSSLLLRLASNDVIGLACYNVDSQH